VRNLNLRLLIPVVCALAVSACQAPAAPAVDGGYPVDRIFASTQCGYAKPSLQLVTSLDQWQRLPLVQLHPGAGKKAWAPGYWRLVVAAGRKPTTGYRLSLGAARRSGTTLKLRIDEQRPAPGMAVGQMMTSPCLVLELPATGWSRIEVHGPGPTPMRVSHP